MRSLGLRTGVLVLLAAMAGGTGGCQGLAYMTSMMVKIFSPDETVDAQYELQGKTVLVLVDTKDPSLASEMPRLQSAMAEAIGKVLADHKACGPIVSARSIEAARKTEPQFADWSVAQVGKYFNADLVVHVEMSQFRLRDDPASNVYHGSAEAAVRIVDTETGQQVWPVLSAARLVSAETAPDVEAESLSEQESILIDGFGDKIARMFITYPRDEVSIRPKVK